MRIPRFRLFGVLCAVLLVSGCSSPTPYGPAPALDGKGYTQSQTQENRYRVTFSGNSLTSRETVETYLLYRAAEITLQTGNDHFRMVDRDTESKTVYHDTVTAPPGFGYYGFGYHRRYWSRWYGYYGYPYGGPGFGYTATVTSHPVTSYEAVADIIVFVRDKAPATLLQDGAQIYDAREIIKRLGPKIVRQEAVAR